MFYGSFSKLDTCNPAPYLKDIRGEKFRFPAPDCLKYDVTGFECTDLGQEWSNFNIFSPKCWIYFKLSNGRWYKGVWLEFQNINFLWRKGVRSRRYATFWDLVPKWRHFRWVNYEKFTLSVNPTVRGWGVISLTLWNEYIYSDFWKQIFSYNPWSRFWRLDVGGGGSENNVGLTLSESLRTLTHPLDCWTGKQ